MNERDTLVELKRLQAERDKFTARLVELKDDMATVKKAIEDMDRETRALIDGIQALPFEVVRMEGPRGE